ncbi:MAG TPA: hypothetical protein PLY93_07425, partial [Turneriella sp.]|nr:hypothetical protein [Turneriella sp.]
MPIKKTVGCRLSFFIFIATALFASSGQKYLHSLSSNDPELKKMRAEVTQNLRTVADGRVPHVVWRRYKIQKKDT